MTQITWQDGFEGAEDLGAVYGAGNVFGGAHLSAGGRSGGTALVCSGSGVRNVPTGIGGSTDPVIVGIARHASVGGNANIALGDASGSLATLSISGLGDVQISLDWVSGHPVYTSGVSTPRIGGIWRYVEFYFQAKTSNGRIVLAIDGDVLIDETVKTVNTLRAPNLCTLNGSGCLIDDFYIGLPDRGAVVGSNPSYPYILGDYAITGTAPSASGSIPSPTDVRVDQQFVTVAQAAEPSDVRVDQQFIIVVIKNKPGSPVRPQVFGVGRV